MGLDIGNETPTTQSSHSQRKKKTHCRCGSTTHLTTQSLKCRLNKRNMIASNLCEAVNEETKEPTVTETNIDGKLAKEAAL